MNIYLVGFMGTGKSSVGRQLAKQKSRLENRGSASNSRSQWNFVDLDELIELQQQRRIVDIFAQDGEAHFRKIEKKTLKQVAAQKKFVVACGGGIVLDKDNIKLMKKNGIVICLCASGTEILKRISGSTLRPILNVAKPRERIELLLKMRAPYYAQADYTVDTSKLAIKQVVQKIIKVTSEKNQDDRKK
jgi:shikimate kinase